MIYDIYSQYYCVTLSSSFVVNLFATSLIFRCSDIRNKRRRCAETTQFPWLKNDHRLLSTLYFKYHAPFQDTASSRARCLFTSTTLLSNAIAVYRKKKSLCVCIFCRSARPLPCDVVAEPQTSTLQVETSNQIYAF